MTPWPANTLMVLGLKRYFPTGAKCVPGSRSHAATPQMTQRGLQVVKRWWRQVMVDATQKRLILDHAIVLSLSVMPNSL